MDIHGTSEPEGDTPPHPWALETLGLQPGATEEEMRATALKILGLPPDATRERGASPTEVSFAVLKKTESCDPKRQEQVAGEKKNEIIAEYNRILLARGILSGVDAYEGETVTVTAPAVAPKAFGVTAEDTMMLKALARLIRAMNPSPSSMAVVRPVINRPAMTGLTASKASAPPETVASPQSNSTNRLLESAMLFAVVGNACVHRVSAVRRAVSNTLQNAQTRTQQTITDIRTQHVPRILEQMRAAALPLTIGLATTAAIAACMSGDTHSGHHQATAAPEATAHLPAPAVQAMAHATLSGHTTVSGDFVRLHRDGKTLELLRKGQNVNVLGQTGAQFRVSVTGPDGRQWKGTVAPQFLTATAG
jgi:hypothetical protein